MDDRGRQPETQECALIVSVGGSPEPVVESIVDHRPHLVGFFVSQQSVDLVGGIKDAVAARGAALATRRDHKILLADPEDLVDCYGRALEFADFLDQHGVAAQDTIVDLTGGTKTMTAALALAAARLGYRYSYVGGEERTKDGMGVVLSGSERLRDFPNPWALFAEEEKRRIAQHFNSYRFAAAAQLLRGVRSRVRPATGRLFEALAWVSDGYERWDQFNHRGAQTALGQGRQAMQQIADLAPAPWHEAFLDTLSHNMEWLGAVRRETNGGKRAHIVLAQDLVANARRRMAEGKFDDAMARLYRAVEVIGQTAFAEHFQCSTSKVLPEKLPAEIREQFVQRHLDEGEQTLKLSLMATFEALDKAGNQAGQLFAANQQRFGNLLFHRNQSILAHGFQPVKEQKCRALLEAIGSIFGVHGNDITFAKLPW